MTTNGVHVSAEIPDQPPEDPQERERLQWQMLRESYRIARNYDRLTRTTKTVISVLLWVAGTVTALAALGDLLRSYFTGAGR